MGTLTFVGAFALAAVRLVPSSRTPLALRREFGLAEGGGKDGGYLAMGESVGA